jgi:hypothetical protein
MEIDTVLRPLHVKLDGLGSETYRYSHGCIAVSEVISVAPCISTCKTKLPYSSIPTWNPMEANSVNLLAVIRSAMLGLLWPGTDATQFVEEIKFCYPFPREIQLGITARYLSGI